MRFQRGQVVVDSLHLPSFEKLLQRRPRIIHSGPDARPRVGADADESKFGQGANRK